MAEKESDVFEYLKQILSATQLYFDNPVENAAHLDVLEKCEILVDCVLDSRELTVFTDSFTALLNILNGNSRQVSAEQSRKILQFFVPLVQSPVGIWRETLADKFDLHLDLVKFLTKNKTTMNLDLGFNILNKLSNCSKKTPCQQYIMKLIPFLLGHIKSDDPMQLCALEVLANVRRDNPAVQEVMQSYVNIEAFYDLLVSLISVNGDVASVQALLVVTSLVLTETDEEEWISNNGNDLLKFIFSSIIQGDTDVKCNHLDLFSSLLGRNSFISILHSYPHFSKWFVMMLNEVFTCDSEPVVMAKLFELLTGILRKPLLRPMLKSVMAAPIGVALNWMGKRIEVAWKASTQSVHFLCELLEGDCSIVLSDHFGEVVSTVKRELELPIDADDYILDVKLSKKVAVLRLLNLLCNNNAFVVFAKENLNLDYVIGKLHSMLADFRFKSYQSHNFGATFSNCWNLKVSVVLETVQFVLHANKDDDDLQKHMLQVFADHHMMQVLCLALSSTSEKDVNLAMQLICKASNYPTFQYKCLVKYVTARNCEKKSRSSESLETKMPVIHPLMENNFTLSNDSRNKSVEEVTKITDLKPSQVIILYEKKISSYEARLKTMESLLKSKTDLLLQELSNSNRLWIQCHAETIQFRELLKESEQRIEMSEENLAINISKQHDLQSQVALLTEDAETMKRYTDKQKDAIEIFKQKIECKNKENSALKNEAKQMGNLNKLLGQHLSEAKEQIEKLVAEKATAEVDMRNNLKVTRDELEEQLERVKRLTGKLESCKSNLQACKSELETERCECARKNSEISKLTAKLSTVTEKLEAMENEMVNYRQMAQLIQNAAKKLAP